MFLNRLSKDAGKQIILAGKQKKLMKLACLNRNPG